MVFLSVSTNHGMASFVVSNVVLIIRKWSLLAKPCDLGRVIVSYAVWSHVTTLLLTPGVWYVI